MSREGRTAFTVVDGGLSSALVEQGHDLTSSLWTARLLIDDPDAIVEAHLAFLRAGAEVIISSSYQASIDGFRAAGLDASQARDALVATTALARRAQRMFARGNRDAPRSVRVAASVGPYGATLADGSEYLGHYAISDEALVAFHAERLAILVESEPDLLACETIPTVREARAIVDALSMVRALPTWMTFTCSSDSSTAGGDSIEAAIAVATTSPSVVAVGINCTAADYAGELLRRTATVTALPLVVYCNGGQQWDTAAKAWTGRRADTPDRQTVQHWLETGARFIGGCCGVGLAEIAALARLRNALRKL